MEAVVRRAYEAFREVQAGRGVDLEGVEERLRNQRVETPSWGYGNSGTRFAVFPQPGVPRNPFEKLQDAAQVVAKQKLRTVQECLEDLSTNVVARRLLQRHVLLGRERQVIETLENCDDDELNYVVTNVQLARLCYKVKDHHYTRNPNFNRSRLLELLCRTRLDALHTNARAAVLSALQALPISAHRRGQEFAAAVRCRTTDTSRSN